MQVFIWIARSRDPGKLRRWNILTSRETIREPDRLLIHNSERRLAGWAEHFQGQFSWLLESMSLATAPVIFQWSATTDPSIKAEILSEIQNLGCHKAPGSDDLCQAPKNGEMELVKEYVWKCLVFQEIPFVVGTGSR